MAEGAGGGVRATANEARGGGSGRSGAAWVTPLTPQWEPGGRVCPSPSLILGVGEGKSDRGGRGVVKLGRNSQVLGPGGDGIERPRGMG